MMNIDEHYPMGKIHAYNRYSSNLYCFKLCLSK